MTQEEVEAFARVVRNATVREIQLIISSEATSWREAISDSPEPDGVRRNEWCEFACEILEGMADTVYDQRTDIPSPDYVGSAVKK